MKADLSKVPYSDAELAAVGHVCGVIDDVVKQAGPDDEEPGIDADDVGAILMGGFAPGTAVATYLSEAKTTRELVKRIKDIAAGVERAYDLIGHPPSAPV